MFELLKAGGILMVPILACSILALAIILALLDAQTVQGNASAHHQRTVAVDQEKGA